MVRKRTLALDLYRQVMKGRHLTRNVRILNQMVEDNDPYAIYVVGKIYQTGVKDLYPSKKLSRKYLDRAFPRLVALANSGDEVAARIVDNYDDSTIDDFINPNDQHISALPPQRQVIEPLGPVVPVVAQAPKASSAEPTDYIHTSQALVDPLDTLKEAEQMLFSGKHLDKALRIVKKACHAKNGYAYYIAGAILRYGIKDLEPNITQSDRYFKLSFNSLKDVEERTARRMTAALFRDGFGGVPVDEQMSLEMFASASALGDAKSSVYLARYYENPKHLDEVEASHYWEIAISQGSMDGIGTLGTESSEIEGPRDITVNPYIVASEEEPVEEVAESQDIDVVIESDEELPEAIETISLREGRDDVLPDVPEQDTSVADEVIVPDAEAVGVIHATEEKLDLQEVEEPIREPEVEEVIPATDIRVEEIEKVEDVKIEYIVSDEMPKTSSDILDEQEVDFAALRAEVTPTEEEANEEDADIKAEKLLLNAIHRLKHSNIEVRNSALPLAKLSAKYGSLRALVLLGYLYEEGIVVRPNKDVAIEYYNIASERGSSVATYRRGLIYIKDEKDVGLFNIRKSAEMGLPKAINELGNMHYEGELGLRNPNTAYQFYLLAADRDDPVAYHNLAILDEREGNEDLAKQHREKAYSLGFKDNTDTSNINI